MDDLTALAGRVVGGEFLQRAELLHALELSRACATALFTVADRVRRHFMGDAVTLCCIVPGRLGGCGEDCRWCSQSRLGPLGGEKPTRTPRERIVAAARAAARAGAGCLGIVNSGRRPGDGDLDDVIGAIDAIRHDAQAQAAGPLRVCASLGELTPDQARRLARGGVFLVHHNLETSRRFFPSVVTTHTYDDRLATLRNAQTAGMDVCSGGLLGLGETWEDRVDLALTLRDVSPRVVPLNFLHPIPGTELEHQPPMEPMDILRAVAMFRLALPRADIKLCGGRVVNLRDMQSWAFFAGASSLMTGDYLTTAGRSAQQDAQMIADAGMTLVTPRTGQSAAAPRTCFCTSAPR